MSCEVDKIDNISCVLHVKRVIGTCLHIEEEEEKANRHLLGTGACSFGV